MRRYCLYTSGVPGSSGFLHQIRQLQQIVVAEQTPSSAQHNKRICRHYRCPASWNGAQKAAAVVKVDSILAPVVAVRDQLETLALQRMVWMDDFKGTVGTVA